MWRCSASSLWEQSKHLKGRAWLCVRWDWYWTDTIHVKRIYHNLQQTYCSKQYGPYLCILRSEEGAHIGGKRFFEESLKADYWASELFFFLWGQKPPISNAQESAWPQRYHFQLFTKYISQNFSHGLCGFSQLFFFHYPTQKILTDGNHTTSIFYKICSASSFSSCIKFWYPLRKSLP